MFWYVTAYTDEGDRESGPWVTECGEIVVAPSKDEAITNSSFVADRSCFGVNARPASELEVAEWQEYR